MSRSKNHESTGAGSPSGHAPLWPRFSPSGQDLCSSCDDEGPAVVLYPRGRLPLVARRTSSRPPPSSSQIHGRERLFLLFQLCKIMDLSHHCQISSEQSFFLLLSPRSAPKSPNSKQCMHCLMCGNLSAEVRLLGAHIRI